jgi:hypothetical protein
MENMNFSLVGLLARANLVLSSANVIISFSLLVYLLTNNFRNPVARAFCAVLAFTSVVYVGDVFLDGIDTMAAARFWLKFQWLGIAFISAAYFHFSDTLLRTTNAFSRWRRAVALAGYGLSLVFLLIVLNTDWLVHDGVFTPTAAHLAAGWLFPVFAAYFFVGASGGALNVLRARHRCLTPTSRRRMSYVLSSVFAPLSVFPYLVAAGPFAKPDQVPLLFGLLVAAANLGTAMMTVVMTYGVAYHGVLMPDRVVKRSLIKYLIQGPILGTCVIGLMLLVPPAERVLGLPRDAVLSLAVIVGIVLFQLVINLTRPLVDLLVGWGDWEEIEWMRRLDERLLTSTDLRQLLENILTALCDQLRVETGFVAVMVDGRLRLDTVCGSRALAVQWLEQIDPLKLLTADSRQPTAGSAWDNGQQSAVGGRVEFVRQDGFWLRPLYSHTGPATLGLLALQARPGENLFDDDELRTRIEPLVERAELALDDRRLQQGVFGVLKQMAAEIESLQKVRGTARYVGSPPLPSVDDHLVYSPDFAGWVKDALSHYWGGPKLTESPLLRLRIVREALEENDYNPARAMRSVLDRALEQLKPGGQRSLTATEWILYNILELRFIRGQNARDVAHRLAMSESDLYRKQRVAIDEVAKQLASMEEQTR